jgi:hypothetical protein
VHQGGSKKATAPETQKIMTQPQKKLVPATRNYFTPLRTTEMETEEEGD